MGPRTLMRIRGKRGAPEEVKWHSGKRRKVLHPGSTIPSERSSSARSTPSAASVSRRRRRKRAVELSQLESLPTEVLQAIFEYSANLDLPLASPRLASQLASRHLYHSLTSIILRPELNSYCSSADLQAADRLVESKFFTWAFFRSWLHEQFEACRTDPQWRNVFDTVFSRYITTARVEEQEGWTWETLRPRTRLHPPVKLLRGPFTQDKIQLLKFLLKTFEHVAYPDAVNPVYAERAEEGLRQAVSEGARDALQSFWSLGLEPDTELLRLAVIDSGCDKEIVRSLVNRVYNVTSGPGNIDFLDPPLWSWADKAQVDGNGKGRWLKGLLKDAVRESSRKKGAEHKHAKATSDL